MRLIGECHLVVTRPAVGAVDQHGDHDLNPGRHQIPDKPLQRIEHQILRSLTGIRQHDDMRDWRLNRLDQQPLGRHAIQHSPAHAEGPAIGSLGNHRRLVVFGDALQVSRDAWIDESNDLAKSLSVGGDRLFVSFGRRRVAMPQQVSCLNRRGNLAIHKLVQPVHHPIGQIPLPRQRLGVGKLIGKVIRPGQRQARNQTDSEQQQTRHVVLRMIWDDLGVSSNRWSRCLTWVLAISAGSLPITLIASQYPTSRLHRRQFPDMDRREVARVLSVLVEVSSVAVAAAVGGDHCQTLAVGMQCD